MKTLPIFRTGQHVALNGMSIDFTVTDLMATAAAYKPDVHEAPLVVGHPNLDAPAFGWVASLSVAEDTLLATPRQVDAEFSLMVQEGRFKKVSASFYLPESPRNPHPGVYYLRHVGFLGAHPPAVKGLPDPAFADDQSQEDVITVEFGEIPFHEQQQNMWRRLHQWMTGRFGSTEADAVVAGNLAPPGESNFSEELPKKEEWQHREQQLAEREAALQLQQVVAFVETQVGAGKILPGDQQPLVALITLLATQETVVFGESGEECALSTWFQHWLASRPVVVEYRELGGEEGDTLDVGYRPPEGYVADPESLARHQRILVHSRRHGADYLTAMRAVSQS